MIISIKCRDCANSDDCHLLYSADNIPCRQCFLQDKECSLSVLTDVNPHKPECLNSTAVLESLADTTEQELREFASATWQSKLDAAGSGGLENFDYKKALVLVLVDVTCAANKSDDTAQALTCDVATIQRDCGIIKTIIEIMRNL